MDVSSADILEQGHRRPAPRGGHSVRGGGRDLPQVDARRGQGAECPGDGRLGETFKNFVKACTEDLPSIFCKISSRRRRNKGDSVIMIAYVRRRIYFENNI